MPNISTPLGNRTQDHINCERWKSQALKECKLVRNIISKIRESSSMKFSDSCISCEYCNDAYSAGLKGGLRLGPEPNDQDILLCEDSLSSAAEVQTVLSHELVHYLDHIRQTDWSDEKALARSEIRAAKYSLECHNERNGGRFYEGAMEHPVTCTISQQFKECVRDKAVNSVSLIRNIPAFQARSIVDGVFDKAYSEEL